MSKTAPVAPVPIQRDALAAWLARAADDETIVQLELEAGEGDDARTIYAVAWNTDRESSGTMAAELRGAAAAHGELQAGPVVYSLKLSREGATAITPLRVSGPNATGALATGAPADLLATAQRHAETAHGLSMRTLSAASDAIRALAVEVRERAREDQEEIRYWRTKSKELREAEDRAVREAAQLETQQALEVEREKRVSRLLEQGAQLVLPRIAAKLGPVPAASSAGSPQGVDALAKVRAAWGHLSPETVERIAADLPPDVALELVATLQGAEGPDPKP